MKTNKRIINCLSLFLLLLLTGQVYGGSVFGPEEFAIEKGNRSVSAHGFNAEPLVPGKIVVTKLFGGDVFWRGKLLLNGNKIGLRKFLRSEDYVFEKDVLLQQNNELRIVFHGQRGAALSVEIVQEDPPTALLQAYPDGIVQGESSMLTWTTENADECFLTPDIGAVDCNGSIEVTPKGTTEFTLTAANTVQGEEVTATTTVGVRIVVPSATMAVIPDHIEKGDSVTLIWSSLDADNCSITPDVGPVNCNDSINIIPEGTTNYIFMAENTSSGMKASAYADVNVKLVVPTVSVSADPANIELGTSSIISWTSAGADSCNLSPDIGEVDCIGAVEVSPAGTTTYILSAKNTPSGTMAIGMVQVGVRLVVPSASLVADPVEISAGESSLLTWSSTDADECSIVGIGPVDCNGSLEVTPMGSMDFIFVANNTLSGTASSAIAEVSVLSVIQEPDTTSP